jgi:hypothetical protein
VIPGSGAQPAPADAAGRPHGRDREPPRDAARARRDTTPRRSGSSLGPLGATGGWDAFSLIFSLTHSDVACRRQVSTDCPGKPRGRPGTSAQPQAHRQTRSTRPGSESTGDPHLPIQTTQLDEREPAARAHRQQACQPMNTPSPAAQANSQGAPARFQHRPLTGHAHSSRYGTPWMITLAVMRATRTAVRESQRADWS